MRAMRVGATVVILLGALLLTRSVNAADATYGHCRDDVLEFAGHSFMPGPSGTVCAACEGPDFGGCHTTFLSAWSCGSAPFPGHDSCPNQ
jgi:hypothetical protein